MSEQPITSNSNSSNPTPKFSIGDIVYLTTHLPLSFTNSEKVTLPLSFTKSKKVTIHSRTLPPPMVIVEITIAPTTNECFDEVSGNKTKERIKYECLRFFPKKNIFEKSWFFESFLVVDENETKLDSPDNLAFSDTVVLKTYKEVPIKKGEEKTELRFIAPAMVVLDVLKEKDTVPLFDKKTGKQIRFISKQKVKCMWYNKTENKFSEQIFPIESLVKIEK